MTRLATGLLVSALARRVAQAGGSAAVLARGDADAGGVVVICAERGEIIRIIELGRTHDDVPEWRDVGGQVTDGRSEICDYLDRRRAIDPDLWALELDIADAERFAAELIARD